jgi:hypothetical protein
MSAVGLILLAGLSPTTLAVLLLTALDESKCRKRIADQQWKDVEGQ